MGTPPEFPNATQFRAITAVMDPGNGEQLGSVDLNFTVNDNPTSDSYPAVTPLEIADAINSLYEAKGWPHMLFSGQQAAVPLNPAP